jgi:predicted nucleic acid-binding protein
MPLRPQSYESAYCKDCADAHCILHESEAIALATEVHAEVVLIDEQAGREEAVRRGLKVAGYALGS